MLCYFYVILCAKSYVLSSEKWKDCDFQNASDTHIFYLLFTTALVFSVVCMIGGNIKLFYKMLRS
jgi:hypothetical protein